MATVCSLVGAPPGVSVNPSTCAITVLAGTVPPGVWTFTIRRTDSNTGALISDDPFTIDVPETGSTTTVFYMVDSFGKCGSSCIVDEAGVPYASTEDPVGGECFVIPRGEGGCIVDETGTPYSTSAGCFVVPQPPDPVCLVDSDGNPLPTDGNGCVVIPAGSGPTCLVDENGVPYPTDASGCVVVPNPPDPVDPTCLVDETGAAYPTDASGCVVIPQPVDPVQVCIVDENNVSYPTTTIGGETCFVIPTSPGGEVGCLVDICGDPIPVDANGCSIIPKCHVAVDPATGELTFVTLDGVGGLTSVPIGERVPLFPDDHCQILRGDGSWANEDNGSIIRPGGGGLTDFTAALPPPPQFTLGLLSAQVIDQVTYTNTDPCQQIVTFSARVGTQIAGTSLDDEGDFLVTIRNLIQTATSSVLESDTFTGTMPNRPQFLGTNDNLELCETVAPGQTITFQMLTQLSLNRGDFDQWLASTGSYTFHVLNHTNDE